MASWRALGSLGRALPAAAPIRLAAPANSRALAIPCRMSRLGHGKHTRLPREPRFVASAAHLQAPHQREMTTSSSSPVDLRDLAATAVEDLNAALRKRGDRLDPTAQRSVAGFLHAVKDRGAEHTPEFYGNLIRCSIDAEMLPTARVLFDALQSGQSELEPEAAGKIGAVSAVTRVRTTIDTSHRTGR